MHSQRLVATLLASCFLQGVCAADWPTFLHDNARAGSTAEKLAFPLQRTWVYSSPVAPRRAWSGPEGRVVEGKELRDRVKFDDAFQVAVVDGVLYFGSSVDHQVRAMDVKTGRELWHFSTGAPVRLAPTVVDGRAFVGSDDGYAYCLDAKTGRLVWKFRLGPAEEWLIARGELISRWPVRTGILVDGGTAYFGVGIFPHENVYLCAVDASSGKTVWRNDHISHLDAGRNDLSPQGYLLATDDRLFVPSGRTRARSVDRATGRYSSSAGAAAMKLKETQIAGTDALIANGRLQTYSLGTRMAVAGDSTFVATGAYVMSIDRKGFAAANSKRARIAREVRDLTLKLRNPGNKADEYKKRIAELQQQHKATETEGVVWRKPSQAELSLIATADHVVVGDKNVVTVHSAANGDEVWKSAVDGDVRGLAATDGNLFVSTTTGKIYRFSQAGEVAATPQSPDPVPFPADEWTETYQRAAQQILECSGVTRGYCLVLGSEQGRLAYELAKRSDLKIYGIEPDEDKVRASRQALSAARLYGHRISIHHGDLSKISYPNYFANLIVSDRLLLTGQIPGRPDRIARHLKPAGGMIVLGRPANAPGPAVTQNALTEWFRKTDLNEQSTVETPASWALLKRGTLPGAGNWTHQYGEPGNTANSGDKLVKGGLGVLWYGDPGPGMMVNRHQGAVGPLVVDGRLFVQGTDRLMAFDAYNGLFLWEHENPQAIRTGVFQNRAPGNLAIGGRSVFHMIREKVVEHADDDGRVKAVHELPPSVNRDTHEWGYVAFRDGLLIGTATAREVIKRERRRRGNPGAATTDALFAIDTKTGKHLWVYQGKSIDFQTIALGPQRVFFIDSSITGEQRAALLREDKAKLKDLTGEAAKLAEERLKKADVRLSVALDALSGKELWSKPVDVTDCSEIGIGGGKLTLIHSDGVLLLCGANANGHYWKQFVAGEFRRRRLVALSAEDGYKLWAKDANYRHRPIIIGQRVIAEPWSYDLTSGEQLTRKDPLTGLEVPWSFMRPGHHCGMLTGCDNLLLFRSGYTAFYDLQEDSGTRHFAGHRLGCWINAVAANGLVVIPEASAGCVCMFSIAATIVMEPRAPRRPWSLYSGVGATTPVKQLSLNLGAPGDRRDQDGQLWLAYPRPVPNSRLETSLDLKFEMETQFSPGGAFFSNDGDAAVHDTSKVSWVASSGGRGLMRCSIPLLKKDDPAAVYNVRLHFSGPMSDDQRKPAFQVRVQGKPVSQAVDAAAPRKSQLQLVSHEAEAVEVTDNLVIEIVPNLQNPEPAQMPILCGIEVRQRD